MNNETQKKSGCTISLSTLLTGIFVILKLTGTISWSWFWVLSPTIFSVAAWVTIIGLLASIAGIAALVAKSRLKNEIYGHKRRRNLGRTNSQEYDFNRSFVDEVSRDETFNAVKEAAERFDYLSRREKINMLKEELNRVERKRPQDIIYINEEDIKEEKPYTHNYRK